MHVLGKVLLGFAVVLIIVAIFLTTMTLEVRSKWLDQIEKKQDQLAQSEASLREAELKFQALEEELDRMAHLWGDAWTAPRSNPQPNGNGVIEIGVGESAGLGAKAKAQGKPLPAIHVFAKGPEGSQYLGEFNIVDLRADRTAAKLTRDPHPGEVASWPSGEYRVWQVIPPGRLTAISDIEGQLFTSKSMRRFQQEELAILQKQIQASQEALDQRLAELNGDAAAPTGASQEVIDGLVQTLRNYEAKRSNLLSEVDQLRRNMDSQYVKLQSVIAANKAKVQEMSQAGGEPAGSPSTVARSK